MRSNTVRRSAMAGVTFWLICASIGLIEVSVTLPSSLASEATESIRLGTALPAISPPPASISPLRPSRISTNGALSNPGVAITARLSEGIFSGLRKLSVTRKTVRPSLATGSTCITLPTSNPS